jgi:hypothetical protein
VLVLNGKETGSESLFPEIEASLVPILSNVACNRVSAPFSADYDGKIRSCLLKSLAIIGHIIVFAVLF